MRPPQIPIRHYALIEVNGKRQTVISRHSTRFEAFRAKRHLEGILTGRLIVRQRWA